MSTPKTRNPIQSDISLSVGVANFNRRIEEGLQRAPIERAKAIREFWGWIRSAL